MVTWHPVAAESFVTSRARALTQDLLRTIGRHETQHVRNRPATANQRCLRQKTGDSYILNIPFLEGPKQPEGFGYEQVQVRVLLPEGAA